MNKLKPSIYKPALSRLVLGFTLIELMISITISFFIMIALIAILVNTSRTNTEMAKANSQIENGRFAAHLLQNDLVLAGFWGTYVPQFDNITLTTIPTDAPTAVPDPCLAYTVPNWTTAYKSNLLGVAVQPVPSGNCTAILTDQQNHTDAIVVRHAETCIPGSGNCAANTAGALYFQSSLCSKAAQIGSTATTIKLDANSSAVDDSYTGTIRILSGTGSGQSRTISSYNGATKVLTVTAAWTTTPDSSSNYSFDTVDYLLDTASLTLGQKDCTTTASLRKFVSNIYYIRNYSVTAGDGIPTLMRSQFDLVSGVLQHQPPVALIEGIEGFRVEYGIDHLSDSGADVDYTAAVTWASPTNQVSPTNRGDGNADGAYVRCPPATATAISTATASSPAATVCTAAPTTAAEKLINLTNAVEVKLYLLARSKETSPGHTDTKTYSLGSTTLGPFNDGFQRHVFSTTVRLTNVSGRRETP